MPKKCHLTLCRGCYTAFPGSNPSLHRQLAMQTNMLYSRSNHSFPAPSVAPIDGSLISVLRKHRGLDDVAETQAQRPK